MLQAFLHLGAGDLARVLSLPATFAFVMLCGWLNNWLAARRRPRRYTPPQHIHTIDWSRSQIVYEGEGTVRAWCCVQGCGLMVYIGREMVPQDLEAYREGVAMRRGRP